MIKILHFITDSNIGGAGKLLCNQIKTIDVKRFEIFVALPKKSALIKELRSLPCTIINCDYSNDRSFSFGAVIENIHIINAVRPDVVHSHASLSSRIAATILNTPSRIFTRHCTFPPSSNMKNTIVKKIVGKANDILSTKIIAVADTARNDLIAMGCDEKRISTVINGVEPIERLSEDEKSYIRARLGIEKDDFVITILARLEEYKGHETLLRALKLCLESHPDFKLIIAGDGTEKSRLIAMCRRMNIENNVMFLGFCEDVAPILNITDVNVNCSYGTETSCLALSEAMSLGIPCVASDYGGNPHMVKNEVNGLIFPQKDVASLANALIRLYEDRELYEKCSAGAYKRYIEEFNARAMTQKMMNIYYNEHLKAKYKKLRLQQ